MIAPRARAYDLGNGEIWERQKGELLRPDAFALRDIERLRASKRPGYETLQQQNPGHREKMRIKAEHFATFSPMTMPASHSAVVLSVDPGSKAGPTDSYSVVQAWLPDGLTHRLLDQWREQQPYTELRTALRRFIRRYRPSVVLIEDTGQVPALLSEIRAQTGMTVHAIIPVDEKIERIGRHLPTIRAGRIQLPEDAAWREEFISDMSLFPYAGFDDQVDATAQYLEWIAAHPNPPKRSNQGLAAVVNSRGMVLPPAHVQPSTHGRAVIAVCRRRW